MLFMVRGMNECDVVDEETRPIGFRICGVEMRRDLVDEKNGKM